MNRLDEKLSRIRSGPYRRRDFIIADAKDGDMVSGRHATGPKREPDGSWTRHRTRAEFLDGIRALVAQDIVDIMLVSASNLELLTQDGTFHGSAVKPAVRANDATDIWGVRGGGYGRLRSRPFRSASLPVLRPMTDLGLYSVTFSNDLDHDRALLEAYGAFRAEARACGFRYILEVFNPNVECGIEAGLVPHFVNDSILRCLAGLTRAERPEFLKVAYNGPRALDELASFDPGLIVGVLGGGAGTARDTFELLHQAERYGARVALFGRKINLSESPLALVRLMREVADGAVMPAEAVRAYHAELHKAGIAPLRPVEEDNEITEAALKQAALP